jgi:hypothetical protein
MNYRYKQFLFLFLFLICFGCVSVQQQISEEEHVKIEGFVGPVFIDETKFNDQSSPLVYDRMTASDELLPMNNNVTYEGVFQGKLVYIRNCRGCIKDPIISQDKLVLVHSYGGGASNRETTKLLWNGKYYQNPKGEYIVDVMLFSDVVDIRRAMLTEKKILDVTALRREGVRSVWINLIGYKKLIEYRY